MSKGKKVTIDFEKALSELEQLVATMERGELSLEHTLEHFERGVELTRHCEQALARAEQRVEQLIASDEGFEIVALGERADDAQP